MHAVITEVLNAPKYVEDLVGKKSQTLPRVVVTATLKPKITPLPASHHQT